MLQEKMENKVVDQKFWKVRAKPFPNMSYLDKIRLLSAIKVSYQASKKSACWGWRKSKRGGYGYFSVKRGDAVRVGYYAHRLVYELLVGPIPDGLTLDHACKNRECSNPDHLRPMTLKDNILDALSLGMSAINSRKTHCKRGHEFSKENTCITNRKKNGRVYRSCRKCKNIIAKAKYHEEDTNV